MLINHPFDILAINETKLDSTISDSEIYINEYIVIRKDRNRNGGGVAFFIKNTLSYSERNDLIPDSGNLEIICIEISKRFCASFIASSWYRPLSSELEIFDNFELFLFKCDLENKELILVGDMNCDFSKMPSDPHSRRLQFLCSMYQPSQLVDEPTRVTENSATLIDLILTDRPENILRSGVNHLGISDLSLIFAVRKFKLQKFSPTTKEVRNFKHFSVDDFRSDLLQVPWDMIFTLYNPNAC
jgi:exonuclease III